VRLSSFLRKKLWERGSRVEKALAKDFARLFGYKFKNESYLLSALTHRSYARVQENAESYERLEYLGDAVLGMLVSEYLFKSHPEYEEGDLTKTKALLVNEATLSTVGKDSGLSSLVLLSGEEEKSGGRTRNSIISDTVEAVIGAIYLDSGLRAAREFVGKFILSRKEEFLADEAHQNYKGELLEFLQGRGDAAPCYEVISEEGPDHDKTFQIAVRAGGKIAGVGVGQSKKEAEQRAAAAALESLKKRDIRSR
jgi:ribonuclease-3